MNKKATAVRNEYMKQWRRQNRERVRQYAERYWTRKAQQLEERPEGESLDKPNNIAI